MLRDTDLVFESDVLIEDHPHFDYPGVKGKGFICRCVCGRSLLVASCKEVAACTCGGFVAWEFDLIREKFELRFMGLLDGVRVFSEVRNWMVAI